MVYIKDNNSIFHHTDSIDKVRKILKEGAFGVQYCSEKIYVSKFKNIHIAIPMVSFADIRLTDYVRTFWKPRTKFVYEKTEDGHEIKKLTKYPFGYYGDFAIGMSKEWAMRQHVCPIVYIPKPMCSQPLPKKHILKAVEKYAHKLISEDKLGRQIEFQYPNILCYCKQYVGVLEKEKEKDNGKYEDVIYSFHNEKEWRFVPDETPIYWNFYNKRTDEHFANKKEEKDALNRNLGWRLDFDLWEDVTYVVVRSSVCVSKIIDIFRTEKDIRLRVPGLTAEQTNKIIKRYEYLCSCIITTEQLCSDL